MSRSGADRPTDAGTFAATTPGVRPALRPAAVLAALVATAIPGCGGCSEPDNGQPDRPHEPPGATEALLSIDGITITFGEVAAGVAFFDSLDPHGSERTKMHRVLDELTLPLRFAQREFADQRRELLAQAVALRSIAGNVHELEEHSARLSRRRQTVTPRDIEIPIAIYLFEPANTGGVSQPIEVPQGFVLAAAFDLQQQDLVLLDRCDALQVGFHSHDAGTWAQWLAGLQARIADRVTYFHPDYRDAMPTWAKLPEPPAGTNGRQSR